MGGGLDRDHRVHAERRRQNGAVDHEEVLAERQINLLAVSSSEIKVSALIAESELELAVRVLHSAFGLDAEQAA